MSPLSPLSLAKRRSTTPSRDGDVRTLLKRHLAEFHSSTPTLILDELGLCEGDVRVDVAAINGELAGFEIKSPADSLARWPKQKRVYSKVLDRAWLVATEKSLEAAKAPAWWGLIRVIETPNQLGIRVLRDAKRNPSPMPSRSRSCCGMPRRWKCSNGAASRAACAANAAHLPGNA